MSFSLSSFVKRFGTLRASSLVGVASLAVVLFGGLVAEAQQTDSSIGGTHYLHRPSLPTGELAQIYRLGGKRVDRLQPVAWRLPETVRVGVATEGRYETNEDGSNAFALAPGAVYRFQITNIPFNPGAALYPTLEVVGLLNPPRGREWDFPIEVVVPQADLELALRGVLITRVVFLENSENAANVDASETPDGLTIDVPYPTDPVAAAETRGRVVAVLRMGSREPFGAPNFDDPFYFGLPPFALKNGEIAVEPITLEGSEAPATAVSGEKPDFAEVAEEPATAVSGEGAADLNTVETPSEVVGAETRAVDAPNADADASNAQ